MDQQLKGQQLMDVVERASMKKADDVPQFEIGDTVDVHTRILEGEKERVQIFRGVVIARNGSGTREMFTVRRIVAGEGGCLRIMIIFASGLYFFRDFGAVSEAR